MTNPLSDIPDDMAEIPAVDPCHHRDQSLLAPALYLCRSFPLSDSGESLQWHLLASWTGDEYIHDILMPATILLP